MIVTVSSTFPGALHPEIEALVRAGFECVEATDVEVHVKARGAARIRGWSGRTYDGVPDIARVTPGTGYLVTLNIPADPRRLTRYPVRARDHRLKTSPEVAFACWQDELLHLAAHEARHVHQFRHGLQRSEVDAERWAAAVLQRAVVTQPSLWP